jgi:hypothetical protein
MENKFKKTYGVEGLIDWQVNLKAGKTTLVVNFTGGGLTSYGVTPAQYTTENILYQFIIENSKEFKKGKIKLLRKVELRPVVKDVVDAELVPDHRIKKQEVLDVFNCSDARIWLKEHRNISIGVKSRQEIIDIAAANGVAFPNLMK